MAQNVGTIYYTVEAETGRLLSAERDVSAATDRMSRKLADADRQAAQLSAGMNKLAAAIKLVIAASAVREVGRMVQSYQEMAERVQMATASQAEYEMVQKRLLATANGTYRALSEAQELYIRTADSLRSMGYNTAQAIDVQDSMSYAFVKNATSADRAEAAISAFSKSINTGKVAADQWETLTSAIPSVINDIAEASGKSAAEVRALGAAGKLTAQDLTEGLRKALESNAAAAAGMAANLTDAGVRTRTAIQAVLVGIESQTGIIQGLTDGLLQAAGAMLAFSSDAGSMASLLDAASIAGASLAAVIAGRVVMAVGSYAVAQAGALRATLAKIQADSLAAQGALRRATAEKAAAMQAVATATAEFQAARGTGAHALAADALTAARTRATAAAAAYATAQGAANAAAAAGIGVATRLRAAMAFLGGPAGLFFLVATAAYHLVSSLRDTSKSMDGVIARVNAMRKASGNGALEEIRADAETTRAKINELTESVRRLYTEQAASIPDSLYNKALKKLNEYKQALSDLEGFEKDAIQLEKDRLALAAQMKSAGGDPVLTSGGTGEKDKAKEDAAKKALAERARLLKENADAVAELQQKFALATLAGEDLAIAMARLALNPAATPAQVAEVEALARALWNLDEIERKRAEWGDDPAKTIAGQASPLSGGMFDSQASRYTAEAEQEQQRYAEQLARLQKAKDDQIAVQGGYNALEEQMAKQHADRMAQIERAKSDVMMSEAADAFGAMASNLSDYVTTFGSQNRALMATMKAAAIAQTIIQTYQGAQAAFTALAGIPVVGPGLATAAAAAAVAGGMARVAAIRAQSGRQYGGPVEASGLYRINENGRPEVFQAANGQQYMLPNTRGEVVSNKDATAKQGPTNVVNIINQSSAVIEQKQTQLPNGGQQTDVLIRDLHSDGNFSRTLQQTFGLRRQGR